MHALPPEPRSLVGPAAVQICNGAGSGNIGDEFMNRAFWQRLPPETALEVEVLPNHLHQRERYPAPHRYVEVGWDGNPLPAPDSRPALLVGDTPITESLGLEWPLRFLAPRLAAFHRAGLPVDALGVGVEPLRSGTARAIFAEFFSPIRSWTVRSPACRDALLDLGVSATRVAVGADWAWLYCPRRNLRAWGAETWGQLGIREGPPLVVVNMVNEIWASNIAVKRTLAAALDALVTKHGFQLAFFCNETRPDGFYDFAAASEARALMRAPAPIVPNLYYGPDEVLGLLGHAAVTVSARYHFTVQSVLAGAIPVTISRSPKTDGLLRELGLEPAGTMEELSAERIVAEVLRAVKHRPDVLGHFAEARRTLKSRAEDNLSLCRRDRGEAQGNRDGSSRPAAGSSPGDRE